MVNINWSSNARARRTLASLGCRRSFGVRFGSYLYLFALTGIASLAWFVGQTNLFSTFKLGTLVSPIVTMGVIFLAIHQWRQLRNEAAIVGSVGRRDRVNEYFRDEKLRFIVTHFYGSEDIPWASDILDKDLWAHQMYIFDEIDNLQDGIEKYRLGYSSPYQALRVIDLFAARCQSPKFVEFVNEMVKPGAGSYTPELVSVVRNIIPGTRYL